MINLCLTTFLIFGLDNMFKVNYNKKIWVNLKALSYFKMDKIKTMLTIF